MSIPVNTLPSPELQKIMTIMLPITTQIMKNDPEFKTFLGAYKNMCSDTAYPGYEAFKQILYQDDQVKLTVAQAMLLTLDRKNKPIVDRKNKPIVDLYNGVKKYLDFEVINARAAEIDQNKIDASVVIHAPPLPAPPVAPSVIKLPVIPSEVSATTIIGIIKSRAQEGVEGDRFLQTAFQVLAEEIEFVEGKIAASKIASNKNFSKLLSPSTLMLALSYATGLSLSDKPVPLCTTKDTNAMKSLLRNNNAKEILEHSGILACVAGAIPRDKVGQYVRDRVRIAMPEAEEPDTMPGAEKPDRILTNKAFRQQQNGIIAVHRSIIEGLSKESRL